MKYLWVTDLKLWLQILQRGNYFNLNEVGYLYRRHDKTDSAVNCHSDLRIAEFLSLVEDFDGWNILNSIQAIRRGGVKGKSLARKHWTRSCQNLSVRADIQAAIDIWKWRRENVTATTS